MKLWILRPINDNQGAWIPWYEKAFGFVICARNEKEARLLAAEDSGDEGRRSWLDDEQSSCVELTISENSKIIIKDFASA